MSLRIDTSEWIAGSLLIGETGLGVLGSLIPATGDSGAGYAYNDLSLPTDNTKEICGRITSWPTAGTLFAFEDTSFEFSGAPDDVYTFAYQLYVDGVATGSPTTVTLSVGAVNGTGTGLPATLSIVAASANAMGTTVIHGTASGAPAVITLDAPTAIGIGTVAGNGFGMGSPASITIVVAEASATGTSGAVNGIATGTPESISITPAAATAAGTGGGFTGSLSDADINRIVVAVLAALNATTIPVDMLKTNGVEIVGDGTSGDKFRSVLYVG